MGLDLTLNTTWKLWFPKWLTQPGPHRGPNAQGDGMLSHPPLVSLTCLYVGLLHAYNPS